MIEPAKFTNSPLGKALEKHTKKQVDAFKSLKPFNKIDKLKQIENQVDDLILDGLTKIRKLKRDKKLNELDYKAKGGKL